MSKRTIWNTNETKHYKMYKAGKQWFFAGLGVVSGLLGAGISTAVKAESMTSSVNLDSDHQDDVLANKDQVVIPAVDSQANKTDSDDHNSQSSTSDSESQTSQSNIESQSQSETKTQSESTSKSESNSASKSESLSESKSESKSKSIADSKRAADSKKKKQADDDIKLKDVPIYIAYLNESGNSIASGHTYHPADSNAPFNELLDSFRSFKGYKMIWGKFQFVLAANGGTVNDFSRAVDKFNDEMQALVADQASWGTLPNLVSKMNAMWTQFMSQWGDENVRSHIAAEFHFYYEEFKDHTAITGHDGTTTAGNPLTTKDLTDSVINADGSKGNVADVIMTSADPNHPLDWNTPGDYQVTLTYWDYTAMTSASVTVWVHVLDDSASTTESTTESTTDSQSSNTQSNTESESMSKSASESASTSASLSSSISAALANDNDGNNSNNQTNNKNVGQEKLPQTGEQLSGLVSTLGSSVLAALGIIEVKKRKIRKKSK